MVAAGLGSQARLGNRVDQFATYVAKAACRKRPPEVHLMDAGRQGSSYGI